MMRESDRKRIPRQVEIRVDDEIYKFKLCKNADNHVAAIQDSFRPIFFGEGYTWNSAIVDCIWKLPVKQPSKKIK